MCYSLYFSAVKTVKIIMCLNLILFLIPFAAVMVNSEKKCYSPVVCSDVGATPGWHQVFPPSTCKGATEVQTTLKDNITYLEKANVHLTNSKIEMNSTIAKQQSQIANLARQYDLRRVEIKSLNATYGAGITDMKQQIGAWSQTITESSVTIQSHESYIASLRTKMMDMGETIKRMNATILEQQREMKMLGKFAASMSGWSRIEYGDQIFLYKFFADEVKYAVAQKNCARIGARLLCTGMREPFVRNKVIKDIIRPLGKVFLWIGLDDLITSRTFVWNDGVVSTKQNTDWFPGEPNSRSERCGEMHNDDRRVNDDSCNDDKSYICEKVV